MAKFFAIVLLFLPFGVFGAVVPVPSLSVAISASPTYQTPGTKVNLTAVASIGKGLGLYIWTVDGVEVARGVDIDRIAVTTGLAGTSKTVRVALADIETGSSGNATYIIRPAEVDLLWEGNTYVPPFYKGKIFPTAASDIVVEAVPSIVVDGEPVSKNSLIFEWTVDGKKQTNASGYGKSVLRTPPVKFRSSTPVSVTVSTPDGAFGARSSVSIPIRSPRVIIYEEKPLLGTWFTRATQILTPLTGDEMAFKAVPFFVLDPLSVSYTWTLNRESFQTSVAEPSIAVFRKTGAGEGQYPVSVTIQKPGSIFERASSGFDLSF